MGPELPNPDDDDLKAKLLENLMEQMDDRIATSSFKDKQKPAEETKEVAAPSGDDLDDDPNLDPALRDLIRSKRGA